MQVWGGLSSPWTQLYRKPVLASAAKCQATTTSDRHGTHEPRVIHELGTNRHRAVDSQSDRQKNKPSPTPYLVQSPRRRLHQLHMCGSDVCCRGQETTRTSRSPAGLPGRHRDASGARSAADHSIVLGPPRPPGPPLRRRLRQIATRMPQTATWPIIESRAGKGEASATTPLRLAVPALMSTRMKLSRRALTRTLGEPLPLLCLWDPLRAALPTYPRGTQNLADQGVGKADMTAKG